MKYFTFTARCTKHNVDLEYVEPEGFEPDFMPIPIDREQDVDPEAVNWGEDKEWELDFAGRWACPTWQKESMQKESADSNYDPFGEIDAEREHWAFIAQNSEGT